MFVSVLLVVSCSSNTSAPSAFVTSSSASSSISSVEASDGLLTLHLISPDGTQDVAVNFETADTGQERAKGLMFREHLDENAGMLFRFDEAAPRNFWMKNTKIPLDIIFFDDKWNIVSMQTMTPCTADPCTSYPSGAPAQYALELNAGFIEKHDITKEWNISMLF